MDENTESNKPKSDRMREFRQQFKQKEKDLWPLKSKLRRLGAYEVLALVVKAGGVDMKSFCGTEAELAYAIEMLYANDGRMLSDFGKDYAMHARGIYYRDGFHDEIATCSRKLWTPSISYGDAEESELDALQTRAVIVAAHSQDNERWPKSEFAWEADAWSDIFQRMRNDPCLEVDKREYMALLAETDPVTCRLTGTSTMVSRIPDATFGLATYDDRDARLPVWAPELCRDRLERLMFHPKYGLISDPKITDIALSFPFMVYEAKGWMGDCRVARRQACSAAAVYLDMLDNLARQPGQTGTPRPYQTPTSHLYQVFVLKSFGAYWHLLVGHRRPRNSSEHAGQDGVSETVYTFRRVWSGRVTDKHNASLLLSLIDQIHLWAVTEYRSFVIDHLKSWHRLCEKNYLLEWDSKYDVLGGKKRERACVDTENLIVPDWVADLPESSRRMLQARAKASLEHAAEESALIKGKYKSQDDDDYWPKYGCKVGDCDCIALTLPAIINHLRETHAFDDRLLASYRCYFQQEQTKSYISERQECGLMPSGQRWPDFAMPNLFGDGGPEPEKIFSIRPAKRRKLPIREKGESSDQD